MVLTALSVTASAGQAVWVGRALLNLSQFPGDLCYSQPVSAAP